jgi:hypothetical protein
MESSLNNNDETAAAAARMCTHERGSGSERFVSVQMTLWAVCSRDSAAPTQLQSECERDCQRHRFMCRLCINRNI